MPWRWLATNLRTMMSGYKEDTHSLSAPCMAIREKTQTASGTNCSAAKMLKAAICHLPKVPWGSMLHEPVTKHVSGIGLWMQMPWYSIQMAMAGMWLTATFRSTGWINNLLQEHCYNSSAVTAEKITVWVAGAHVVRVLCHAQMLVGALTATTIRTLTGPKLTWVMKTEHLQNTIWTYIRHAVL